jgi:hypothetical protein
MCGKERSSRGQAGARWRRDSAAPRLRLRRTLNHPHTSALMRVSLVSLLLLGARGAGALFFPIARLLGARGGARPSRDWASLRAACSVSAACAPLYAGEETACVLACLSPRCARDTYGPAGLEPGEIDGAARTADFARCLRVSEKRLKAAGKWPPRLRADGAALDDVADGDASELLAYTQQPESGAPRADGGGDDTRVASGGGGSGRDDPSASSGAAGAEL